MIAPRPELAAVPGVPHGGFASDLPAGLLDFSANVNPYGPSPRVREALATVPIDRHPDPRAAPLRALLATYSGLPERQVIVGNGSVDLIYQLATAFVRPGDQALVVGPTFGEYAAAVAMMGARVTVLRAGDTPERAPDAERLIAAARAARPRLLFLCNPNNPTGAYHGREQVAELVAALPETLVVLDEAYVNFVVEPWCAVGLLGAGNLLILRSLTKDHALTGLRLGYALGPESVIAALATVQPPWSVNAFAQAAGLAALGDEEHAPRTLAALRGHAAELRGQIAALGFAPQPSAVPFFLIPVGSGGEARQALIARGVLVRDCASFGLPGHIRVAARRPAENERLVAALLAAKEALCPPAS